MVGYLSEKLSLDALQPLHRLYPTMDSAVAEVARLAAVLPLPKGTIHVLSDVHGEDRKLRHVINNASGTLRPLVERLFADLTAEDRQAFLALVFYPKETIEQVEPTLKDDEAKCAYAKTALSRLILLLRTLAENFSLSRALRTLPADYRPLLQELVFHPGGNSEDTWDVMIRRLVELDRVWHLLRLTVRAVRDLAIEELILAGDCWDRGPRGDRVVSYLMEQPNLSFIWGNHDTAWLGACLGHGACIMHVLRISLRYRRLSQLEEGYGIALQPLEHMVRKVYGDDPALSYTLKNSGLRDADMMRRMQKAAAIMQFKLEGQMIDRNPHWGLEHRKLLHQIDLQAGTVAIDGKTYPLRDAKWPTLDPQNPYALSADEQLCLDRIKQSFMNSATLWDQMRFLVGCGSMYLIRDDHLIFHGCVPVDEKGDFLPLEVDGVPLKGRELFEELDRIIVRIVQTSGRHPKLSDLDLMWYLWCGPMSPLFGKDRICTFENDLVEDHATHVETKNPYFQLIHEVPFCDRILREFGVSPARGLIVNGHVPVKVDKGENPIKRSGKAITIDGAFSEAYGDHGYTLVLKPEKTFLALHHHFESVEAAVREGVDIIPTVTTVRDWGGVRTVGETEHGAEIRAQIHLLEQLIDAYRSNAIRQA